MSLYDVIGEISERRITKTETGDARIYGLVVGIVSKNYDKNMPGRVCVTVPTRDDKANELQWARLVMPSSGSSWGHYFLPEVGDQVALAFEGGDIERPYIIGCISKDDSKLISKAVDENNQYKRILTRHGSMISFEDNKEGDGEKDKITIETAGKAHSILIDNENKVIRFTDKSKENLIEMKTEDGQMTVKAKSQITIQVGDSIKLVLNGESGSIKIEANELNIDASKAIKIETDGTMKLIASQLSGSGSSICKFESNGVAQLSGNPIKIG